jgi:hypothetical protein
MRQGDEGVPKDRSHSRIVAMGKEEIIDRNLSHWGFYTQIHGE